MPVTVGPERELLMTAERVVVVEASAVSLWGDSESDGDGECDADGVFPEPVAVSTVVRDGELEMP